MIMKYFYGVISTKWQQSVLIMYSFYILPHQSKLMAYQVTATTKRFNKFKVS